MYRCLHDLRLEVGVSSIARKIALGTPATQKSGLFLLILCLIMNTSQSQIETQGISRVLTQEELSLATSIWPLECERPGKPKELNKFQKEALDIANGNGFTLIQGPPGKLAHAEQPKHAPVNLHGVNYPLPIRYRKDSDWSTSGICSGKEAS